MADLVRRAKEWGSSLADEMTGMSPPSETAIMLDDDNEDNSDELIEEILEVAMGLRRKSISTESFWSRMNKHFEQFKEDILSHVEAQEFELTYNPSLQTLVPSETFPVPLSGILGFEVMPMRCTGDHPLGIKVDIVKDEEAPLRSWVYYRETDYSPMATEFFMVSNDEPLPAAMRVFFIAHMKRMVWPRLDHEDTKAPLLLERGLPLTCLLLHLMLDEPKYQDQVLTVLTCHYKSLYEVPRDLYETLATHHYNAVVSLDANTLQLRLQFVPPHGSDRAVPETLQTKLVVSFVR